MNFSKISLPGTVFCAIMICLLLQGCSEIGIGPDSEGNSHNINSQNSSTANSGMPDISIPDISIIEEKTNNTQMLERQYYLIGFSIALAIIIFLFIALLHKTRESRHHLKVLVKRRTKELEIQKNAAQTAYKVKSRFLANMSHEIRTPLNAIIGFSQAELDKGNPDSKENLFAINRSGTALLEIFNDLLDISSIESGDMQLTNADYSLPMFINNVAAFAKLKIGNKQIRFQLETDENLPSKLHGDRQRIKQILMKLLDNAVKFTKEGSIILRTSFSSLAQENELMLIFEIYDSGIGIKNEDIEKLFTEYSQVDTGTNRSSSGTGMGLIITKKLTELMGGDVNAVSEYGKGSAFTVWIPQKIADKTTLGSDTVERLRTGNWKEVHEQKLCLSYARILLIDDVPTNHAVARGIMRPYKMTIDAVSSGQEAIDLIKAGEPVYDALFMDHMMPEMDGIEATKLIREIPTDYARGVPVIALTANALPENEGLFLSNGFDAFMAKPINVQVLNNILKKWVRNEQKEKLLDLEEQQEESEQVQSSTLINVNIEGVDLAAGAVQFGGEDNYLEIVKVFINDTPKLLEDVKKCLDGFRIMPAAAATALESLKNYTITVHGIKGSCYGICAARVGDLAKELEIAAKSQNLDKVLELNNDFILVTEKLVDELKILFPKKDETTKIEKNAPDPATLQKLLDAAQSYNITAMLEVMDELEQYKYQQGDDLIRQLREASENYDYLEVIKLLNAILILKDNNTIDSIPAG